MSGTKGIANKANSLIDSARKSKSALTRHINKHEECDAGVQDDERFAVPHQACAACRLAFASWLQVCIRDWLVAPWI